MLGVLLKNDGISMQNTYLLILGYSNEKEMVLLNC